MWKDARGERASIFEGIRVAGGFALLILAAACGPSENIGWADRELPETAGARSDPTGQAEGSAALTSREALAQEYQRLAESLAPVQREAMADSGLVALWSALNADVEARILENSGFHRGLLERRAEIERIVEAQQQGAGTEELSDSQMAELARHYRNIQTEMARVRNLEFQKPEFNERLGEFEAALQERMREIAPDRVADIERLIEIEARLIAAADSASQPATAPGDVLPMIPPEELQRILGGPRRGADTTGG